MTQRILNAPRTPDAEIAAEPQVTLDRALPVPDRLILPFIPPTQDQGATGTCVAHMAYGCYQQAHKRKYDRFANIGEQQILAFYDLCKKVDGVADPGRWMGTTLLTAMRVMAGSGFPIVGGRGPKIDGYEFVGSTPADAQRTMLTYGTVVGWRLDWDAQWFYLPRNRVLKPPIGQVVGGHAVYGYGFDNSVNGSSDADRNSWGAWSVAGTGMAWIADRFKTSDRGYEAWRVTGIR